MRVRLAIWMVLCVSLAGGSARFAVAQQPLPDAIPIEAVDVQESPATPEIVPEDVEPESVEVSAIEAASEAFVEAFDAQDAAAVAAAWTVDGALVDETGETYEGREAIEQAYAAYFAENDGARLRLFVDSIRLLSDTAAIEDGRAFVDSPDGASPAFGKYVAVHVKTDGKWLMSLVRETRVEVASAHANVADLEWLIGEWSAEDRAVSMTSVCRWVANKSFVERKYAVTQADGTTTAGVQIIGWNPEIGRVQSWSFNSDGGHAVGVWSPAESGWMAETVGTTGEGASTRATNHLTKLDDGAYVWRSTDRSIDGTSLPDTEEIVMKRQTGR